MNAVTKLARAASTASTSCGDNSREPGIMSALNSSVSRSLTMRRTRRPKAGAFVPLRLSVASAVSSAAIRLVTPNSALTPLSRSAPSPRNHVDTLRLGLVGPDVVIGAPAGGKRRSAVRRQIEQ